MTKCSCIRGTYDFRLENVSCSNITYHDASTWQQGSEYSQYPSYELNVTLSGGSVKTYTAKVGTPLKLDLGTCPDGLYEFSTISCTEKFSKRALVTCNLWCGYLKAMTKVKDPDVLISLRTRIENAELLATSDYIMSIKLVESVKRDLERISCDCSCY